MTPRKPGKIDNMYRLDFETVKQVMQEHRKTGLLYADISPEAVGLRGVCRIEIQLTAGTIISCSIVSDSGQCIADKEAIKRISRLGLLFWTFVPQNGATITGPLSEPPTPALKENFTFPRRVVQVEQWRMQSWSRLHRAIFALADGSRSATKIAGILTAPQDLVDSALRDLESIGVIVMGPYQQKDLLSF